MSSANPSAKPSKRSRRLLRFGVPAWRFALLAAAFFCIHLVHGRREETASRGLDPAWISGVADFLPQAKRFAAPEADDPLTGVLDAEDTILGWVTQTSPEALAVTGYSGPSNLLVVFDTSRHVLGTRLLSSADTAGHLAMIADDPAFFAQWNNRPAASLDNLGYPTLVSGATLTSDAVARGLAARFGATDAAEWFPDELSLPQVRQWFPTAAGIQARRPGIYEVDGVPRRVILRASRMGVAARGFQGPSDVLIALEDGVIRGVAMTGSRDNEPYITDVADELQFTISFAGKKAADLVRTDASAPFIVSGASDTANAIHGTVREMLRRHLSPPPRHAPDWKTITGLAWLATGLAIGLSRLRSHRRLRLVFAGVSMLIGGLWLGWMIGQDQWIGWAKRGDPSGAPLAMLILSAAALLVPAVFGKNIYCSHLCPHGAAQTLLGSFRKRRFSLPAKLHAILKTVPWITLTGLWILAFAGSSFPATQAEPFEIWSAGFFALLPAAIFAVGLASAIFLPQGYCHYGCPTGALLKFLTHAPSRWTRRDIIATALVAAGAVTALVS